MKFSKYDYKLNQINLPESMRGSSEPSEGSAEPEEQPLRMKRSKLTPSSVTKAEEACQHKWILNQSKELWPPQ
jgi:hypothetical protein